MLGAPPGPTRTVLGCDVVEGPTPSPWPAQVHTDRILADHDRALVRHGPASLYVAHGTEIVVSAPDPATRLDYDYLVYAYASRLLLLQRRRFTLHATLVVSPSGAVVAVTGVSTVGKSTTSLELLRRGWQLVCDDVVEARVADGEVLAVPYLRPVHLADEAARMLGVDASVGRELPGRGKRVYAVPPDPEVRPLSAIVRLDLGELDTVESRRLLPSRALPLVAMLSDPNELCQLPEYRADYLRWTADLVSRVPVLEVRRPKGSASVSAVADAVEGLLGHV